MLYLLDANVLITAHTHYYPIDRVPPFWIWLLEQAEADLVKMPFEIHNEIAHANGPVADWVNEKSHRDLLLLDEEVDQTIFNNVINQAYSPDLTDAELEETGMDPFLVTYAVMGQDRRVVTKEISKPSKVRGRRKIPDACNIMSVTWMDDFQFYKEQDFRIS